MKIKKYLMGSLIYQLDRLVDMLNCDKYRSFVWEDYKKDYEYTHENGIHELIVYVNCISSLNSNDVYTSIKCVVYHYDDAEENPFKVYVECHNDNDFEDREFILSRDEKEFMRYMKYPYEN